MADFEAKIEPTKLDVDRISMDDVRRVLGDQSAEMAAFEKSPLARCVGRLFVSGLHDSFLKWLQAENERGTDVATIMSAVANALAALVAEAILMHTPLSRDGTNHDAEVLKIMFRGMSDAATATLAGTRVKQAEAFANPETIEAFKREIMRRVHGNQA